MRYHEEYEAYPLGEVARRIRKEENDILRMAAGGEIGLWVWWDSFQSIEGIESPGWFKVNGKIAARLISRDIITVENFVTIDGRTVFPATEDGPKEIYVPLDGESPFERNSEMDVRYFGSEPARPRLPLIKTIVDLNREYLNVLSQDFQKLTVISVSQNRSEGKKNIDRGILLDTKKSIAQHLNISESTLSRQYIAAGGDHVNRKGRGGHPLMKKIGKQWAAWTDDLDYHMEKINS